MTGIGYWHFIYGDILGLGAGAGAVAATNCERNGVASCRGELMGGVGLIRSLSIIEGPQATHALVCWIGGGGVGELGALSLAHRSGGEVCGRLGEDFYFGGGTVGLAIQGDGAGVGATHGHGAVGAGHRMAVGGPSARSRPTIGGALLCIATQLNVVTYAVGAVALHQRRKNATVGFAGATASHFLEGDVCWGGLVVFCDYHDVVLTHLR